MGKFYIETTKEDPTSGTKIRFELHATTSIGITLTSDLTSYPIEEGSEVTDNVVVKAKSFDLQGVLTDVSQTGFSLKGAIVKLLKNEFKDKAKKSQQLNVVDYIKNLEKRIQNKETFTIRFSKSLKTLDNCVITSFKYLKTNEFGGEAWQISISGQEVRFADRAGLVKEPTVDWQPLLEAAKAEQASTAAAAAGDLSKASDVSATQYAGLSTFDIPRTYP